MVPPTKTPSAARFRQLAIALCCSLMLTTFAGTATAERPEPTIGLRPELMSASTISSYRYNIAVLTNRHRTNNGLPALRTSDRLTYACQSHANEMASRRLMTHTGADGSSGGTRARRYGYVWSAWGENVAAGYMSASQVVNAWMNSSGHRANMLNRRFVNIGIGVQTASNGTPYFCMLLGSP